MFPGVSYAGSSHFPLEPLKIAISGFGRHKVVKATAPELKQGKNKGKVLQGLWKTTVMMH